LPEFLQVRGAQPWGRPAQAVSGTVAATGKQRRGRRRRGQRPAASGTVEDVDQARWSRRCRVPPGSRVMATVSGAWQQLREAWHRSSGADERGSSDSDGGALMTAATPY
jgi:hypothetical protein